jgi:spermidine synthase
MTLAYVVFFLSGFAALGYQIIWQRLLLIFSGSDVQSATIIVAAFMAGLGCGSLAGGRIADRLSRVGSLLACAGAELMIAGFGVFSAGLYYDVLYQRLGHVAWGVEARAAVIFVSLLWPTFFMGVSLPLLARALATDISRAPAITGALYGLNTLGAAVGSLLTTWWLLPQYGVRGSLETCALLNLVSAIALAPIAVRMWTPRIEAAGSTGGRAVTSSQPGPVGVDPVGRRFSAWALLYGLAGFLALSYEIVWFRLMGVMLKSTAFTFGTLLCVYLTGLGLGAALGTTLLGRTRRPARAFLIMQAAVGLYAGVALTALVFAIGNPRSGPSLWSYFGQYEALDLPAAKTALRLFLQGAGDLPREFLFFYFALPALLIAPPTILMGASFPLLQKAVQTDLARLGTRLGTLLMANIAGGALGSIVIGWLALEWLGTPGTLKLLVMASAMFPVLGWMLTAETTSRRDVWIGAGALVAGAMILVALPDARLLWGRFHGAWPALITYGEDGSGTSVLRTTPGRYQSRVLVFVNGSGQSWIPYGGIHTVLGALPAFIHPNPRTAAVIGLGSGDTLFGMAGRRDLERITCIEIIRPQLDTLRELQRLQPYPGLGAILTDPRIEHVTGDGRMHVMRENTRYDLIEADALQPTNAYSGNLYSDAYFQLLRDRLKPGGLAVSWAPTERVHNTFVTVFPYVLSYGDIVIGGREPIELDPSAIRRRLNEPDVQAHFREASLDILALIGPYLDRAPRRFTPADDRASLDDINTDLFPKDEFGVPLRPRRPRTEPRHGTTSIPRRPAPGRSRSRRVAITDAPSTAFRLPREPAD